MGKRRGPDIFDDNPLTEDFLEWMVSPDGQTAGEVSGLVFATLENASVDAKRRKVIWADGERLSIEQSASNTKPDYITGHSLQAVSLLDAVTRGLTMPALNLA